MPSTKSIVLQADPKGTFLEGVIYGTPKPGTVMQIRNTDLVGGRLTWEVFAPGADGNRGLIAVLCEDHLQGKTADDAYVSGDRGFLYCPIAGEELNVLVSAAGTGTGDAIAIGTKLIVENGTGLLVETTGTPESEPFVASEAVADVSATGTLVKVIATGV
jgi:hypothetical protein